jgi:hypothetical protein
MTLAAGCAGANYDLTHLSGGDLVREVFRLERVRRRFWAIDAVLSREAVPGWPGAWAGSLRVTPLLIDPDQARRICARLEARCRS